jgi:HlyD family secretion protein
MLSHFRRHRHRILSPRLWLGSLIVSTSILALAGCDSSLFSGVRELPTKTLTHTVARADLLITVTEDGNVESASNVDIKCQVAGGSSIIWIIPDGSTVEKGDKLVEMDSSAIEEQISTQRIAYEKALSTRSQSEKNFEVAKIAVEEYLDGTFKKALQDAEAAITIAMENLRSSQNALEHAEKMFRKGYVSSLELEGQKFGVERSRIELESAKTAKDVLERYTKAKTLQELQGLRDNAESQMKSDFAAYDLEKARLDRLEAQLKNCTIFAPAEGMVVYANEQGGRGGQQQSAIEEGAAVRERQTILRLPDLSLMQVKVKVHESKVDQISAGMPARIRILERNFTGQVTSTSNQPEPTQWFTGNVKEYATIVRIDGDPDGLRPGLTAAVEILAADLRNVVTLPVAAVIEKRGDYFCWVLANRVPQKRPLVLGMSNDQFVEVKDAVVEGDEVILNPRAVVAEARTMLEDVETADADRFGEATFNPGAAGGGPGARGGGPGAGRPGADGPSGGADGAADPGGSRRGRGGRGGGEGGRDGRGGGGGGMSRLDTDGDGKISKDEAPPMMQDRFDEIDSNSDGFIDSAEMSAMRAKFGGGQGGSGGRGGRGGEN